MWNDEALDEKWSSALFVSKEYQERGGKKNGRLGEREREGGRNIKIKRDFKVTIGIERNW